MPPRANGVPPYGAPRIPPSSNGAPLYRAPPGPGAGRVPSYSVPCPSSATVQLHMARLRALREQSAHLRTARTQILHGLTVHRHTALAKFLHAYAAYLHTARVQVFRVAEPQMCSMCSMLSVSSRLWTSLSLAILSVLRPWQGPRTGGSNRVPHPPILFIRVDFDSVPL